MASDCGLQESLLSYSWVNLCLIGMSWWKSIPCQLLCWSWNVLVGCWSSTFLGMRIMVSHLQYEGLLAKSFQVGLTMIIATPKKMPKSNILRVLRSWFIIKNILLKIIKNHFGGYTKNAIYVCWLTPPIVAFDLKKSLVPRCHVHVGAWAVVTAEAPKCAARRTHYLGTTNETTRTFKEKLNKSSLIFIGIKHDYFIFPTS